MKDNLSKFLSHLDASTAAVFTAALYFYEKGLDVRIGGLRKCDSYSNYMNFVDDGDMFIYRNGEKYRIEVKNLSAEFTSREDWPFKDFMVCAKKAYDHATPKPYAYLIFNKSRTHMAVVKGDTSDSWATVQRTDSRYKNYTQEFYLCDLDLIKWIEI